MQIPVVRGIIDRRMLVNYRVEPGVSVAFDCALLMRNIEHEWHARPTIHLN